MLVGIDIGGTKTHLALEVNGDVDHRVVATASWQDGNLFGEGSADGLLALFMDHVDDPSTTSLAIGAHGCDSPEQVRRFDASVRAHWPGSLCVLNDAELLGPALGLDETISLIVGTGSIVIGRTAASEAVYVGGRGWLLDDFGSAPGITREAVRSVLRAADHGHPRDVLATTLMGHFGAADEVELSVAFTTGADIGFWAAPAPLVFEAADMGSTLAADVVDEAARRLAADAAIARSRGALGATVVAAGGVITHQPRLVEAISKHLAEQEPMLELRLLTVPPVLGALEIARALEPSVAT